MDSCMVILGVWAEITEHFLQITAWCHDSELLF